MNERLKDLAEQAGFDKHHAEYDTRIEHFAELVRQYDRVARGAFLRKQDEQIKEMQLMYERLREKFNKAVLDEREACAKLCEKVHADYINDRSNDGYDWPDGDDCAAAIRARNEK
jgi:hypothetical protein